MTATDRRRRLRRVVRVLDDAYGRPVLTPRYPPVDELVYTILSQNTADVNTDRTFAALKATLQAASERTGAPDLSELDAMTDAEAQAHLTRLPGIGPKTAACVLLFALERPVMPVDTHVHRVARRLGLIEAKASAEQAHPDLTALAGPKAKDIYAAHVDLVRHGRRVCHARLPACGQCPVAGLCPSAGLV